MTATLMRFAERLVTVALPSQDREAVMGDLNEESRARFGRVRGAWKLAHAFRVVINYEIEPYRAPDARLSIVAIAAAGLGLLWIIRVASESVFGGPTAFLDPISQIVAAMWAASEYTSAAAAGLLVGRVPGVPEYAARSRWHVAVSLCVIVAAAATGFWSAVFSISLLLTATWLGDRARDRGDAPRNTARRP